MIVCKGTQNVYYPRPAKRSGLICGSRRIRYYRGFLLVNAKAGSIEGGTGKQNRK